jgi:secondary thiamine-phosphate synthase enzyme
MSEVVIKTSNKREIVDVTDKVNAHIAKEKKQSGVVHLFITHTTAALTTADLDPGGTDQDYLDAFEKIVPKLAYRHPHNPDHMPDHILASLIGASLTVPIENGNLVLGTWQRIVLVECDGPRERRVIITFT